MKFEVGKYYKHTQGHYLSILAPIKTDMWGHTLVAESNADGQSTVLMPIGGDSDSYAVNYHEITRKEWMAAYSTDKSLEIDLSNANAP